MNKKIKRCMGCDSKNFFIALNFGKIPLVGSYLINPKQSSKLFNLSLMICKDCGLGQIPEQPKREEIFIDYSFKSSLNNMTNSIAYEYCNEVIDKFNLKESDWILEIGSNDGYVLKYFKEKGIGVLGIDPSKNISMYAITNGIPTIVDFFGSDIAKDILKLKGYPKLIIANQVMAHGPYIQDFMYGISILCNDQTVVSIENPSIMNILEYNQFETVYHEHYSYLSCNSVSRLANKFGLALFDLEQNPIQGRSNRYWISKNKKINSIVLDTIAQEVHDGLFKPDVWKKYQKNLNAQLKNFYITIKTLNKNNKKVYGYTASGKTVTLLKLAKIKKGWIVGIADDAKEKQGKFLPILKIPIIDLEELISKDPDVVIVFAWNIFEEIKQKYNFKNIRTWQN